ncbi:MAG: protein phosphatase 2C domain-containing protein [Actinomycetia bacterium]|nr:protein phosphatase 2C domain-containing protein [Actinomycetes bacterium]
MLRPCPWAGGASDIGLSHTTNQDSLAIAAGLDADGGRIAAVAVSDGVSTSPHSAQAAHVAATVSANRLADTLQGAGIFSLPDLGSRIHEAFVHANDAVLAAAEFDEPGSWACTLVLAAWWRGRIVVGNIGDSRCYWVPDTGEARLLSTDDSLAQARIELGMARVAAETGAQAHAILKWLGPGAGDPEPTLQALHPKTAGWVIVCSDGLWNYASAPADMERVVHDCLAELGLERPPAWRLAEGLVAWSNSQGGRDNVTVAALDVAAPARPRDDPPAPSQDAGTRVARPTG